jgi:hypothetical protein
MPLRTSGSNVLYSNSGPFALGGTIGKVPAGSLVVVVNILGPIGGGNTQSSPVLGAAGGGLAMQMTEVHVGDPDGYHCGFQAAWAWVPANYANDATLAFSTTFTVGSGSGALGVTSLWAVFDGGDPSKACVSGYIDSLNGGAVGWSTPAVQAPFDGVELHLFASHNEGVSSPSSGLAAGPFASNQGDPALPFNVSLASVIGDHSSGPSHTQSQSIGGTSYVVPGKSTQSIQSAVLVMPLKRADSVGELAA